MVDPEDRPTAGAPPSHVHIGPEHGRKTNWLPWLLLALGLLALLFALSRCGHNESSTVAPPPAPAPATQAAAPAAVPAVPVQRVTLPNGRQIDLEPASLNGQLQRYLASDAPTPRTFTFDKLNFDTASAAIRPEDRATIQALGQILEAYPKARVRLVGYADARGTEPRNDKLGEQRAQAVAVALSRAGIAPDRIGTATGGESNPVDTNATPGGRFENRRTELVVTAK